MEEEPHLSDRIKDLLWPRDLAELLVFGFISLTGAALLGGMLNLFLFGRPN